MKRCPTTATLLLLLRLLIMRMVPVCESFGSQATLARGTVPSPGSCSLGVMPGDSYLGGLSSSPNDDDKNKNNKNNNRENPLEDLTSGIRDTFQNQLDTFQTNVNQLTGKQSYEFGDLTRWMDQKAKDGLSEVWKITSLPDKIQQFTKKPNYQFGDITKELIRRFKEGDYTAEDVWLFLRIAALIGLNIKPIASILPLKVVMELAEVSIAESMGERIVGALTGEVNLRLKEWLVGESALQFGDLTKTAISSMTKVGIGNPEHVATTAASAKAALLEHLADASKIGDATEQTLSKVRQSQSLATVQEIAKKILLRQEERGKEKASKETATESEIDSNNTQNNDNNDDNNNNPTLPPTDSASLSLTRDNEQFLLQDLEEFDRQFLAYKLQEQQKKLANDVEKDPFAEWDRQLLLATSGNAPKQTD